VHYKLFLALSRLKRDSEAEQELIIFKRLDDERKAGRLDFENPTAPSQ
jgi:hypothetical protein